MKINTTLKRILAAAAIIGVLLCLSLYVVSLYVVDYTEDQLVQTLTDISNQDKIILQNETASKMVIIEEIGKRFDDKASFDPEEMVESLSPLVDMYDFKRMGVSLPDGEATTTDHVGLNISNRQYFMDSLNGESRISTVLEDAVDGESINVYSVPLRDAADGEIFGVLFATYSTDVFRELLNVTSFNGAGFTYIIEQNGDVIVDAPRADTYGSSNFFTAIEAVSPENAAAVETIKTSFADNLSGFCLYHYEVDKYLYYSPLELYGNRWYLLTIVPAEVLDARAQPINRCFRLLSALMFLLYLISLYLLWRQQKHQSDYLRRIAFEDELTGGYNYNRFKEELPKLSFEGRRAAFLLIDLDKFTLINEVLGNEVGDRVIKAVSDLLLANREPGELVAHRYADEFTAIWLYEDRDELAARVEELCGQIANCTVTQDLLLVPSVGIYEIKGELLDPERMCSNAMFAKHTVKGNLKQQYAFYVEEQKQGMLKDKTIEDALVFALENGELIAHYQPKYSTHRQQMIGAEALIRWQKSDRLILPGVFIPLCESNRYVVNIDRYMLNLVCNQQRAWRDAGKQLLPISLNLSRASFDQPGFAAECLTTVERYGLPIDMIELEITESLLEDDSDQLKSALRELHDYGFRILLDDFGTGYSSLKTLDEYPIDVLKLDKSLIDGIGSPAGEIIIKNTLRMAKALRMEVIAEGVETIEQFQFLYDNHCDQIQGFYFSKPLPVAELGEQLLPTTHRPIDRR